MATGSSVGLFPITWNIGTGLLGAPSLNLACTVDTPHQVVQGIGHITQPVNPPVNVATAVSGTFTYMTVMPDETHILVVATGVPVVAWPPHGGVGPVLPPNFHLRMVLARDWSSGTAYYRYQNAEGAWIEVNDAPVAIAEPVAAPA